MHHNLYDQSHLLGPIDRFICPTCLDVQDLFTCPRPVYMPKTCFLAKTCLDVQDLFSCQDLFTCPRPVFLPKTCVLAQDLFTCIKPL